MEISFKENDRGKVRGELYKKTKDLRKKAPRRKRTKRKRPDDEVEVKRVKVDSEGQTKVEEEEQICHNKKRPFYKKQRSRANGKPRHVFLRPTNAPHLKAPFNSTQFLMEDHTPTPRSSSPDPLPLQLITPRTPPSEQDSDDSEDFSERDFQSVYESTHQEEISLWDRKRLCQEISALERRQKELRSLLSRLDPEVYVRRLESELLTLQEVNRVLREERAELNPELPDSSTIEEPECKYSDRQTSQDESPSGS